MKAFMSELMERIMKNEESAKNFQKALAAYNHHTDEPVVFVHENKVYTLQLKGKRRGIRDGQRKATFILL